MTIDQELQAALDVEPSPEFAARVRQALAGGPPPRAWRAWGLLPAAGAAVAAAALAVSISRPANDRPDQVPLLPSRSLSPIDAPAALGSRAMVSDDSERRVLARGTGLGAAAGSHTAVARPEGGAGILIDAREARALRRLMAGSPLNLETPYEGPALSAIEIAPISIEPLPAGGEGARQ